MKKNYFNKNAKALYFSHDSNARNDEKLLQLRMKFGWEGYGVYWAILENLRNASNYKLKKEFISGLAYDLKLKEDKLKEIIEFCFGVDLLRSNEVYFHSNGLSKRMKKVDEATEKMRAAGLRGANRRYNKPKINSDVTNYQNPIEDRFNDVLSDEN